MKKAGIAFTKNNLSRIIEAVKNGETFLILDRDTPVAKLEPVDMDQDLSAAEMSGLVKRGIIAPPRKRLDVSSLLRAQAPALAQGSSGVRTLLEEREGGR
jgi:antitoxin (DNA-binding transcriptional repressor) of toxin-antitoxin stability system